jgi:FHS family L-fucose permease-like MFS transporter
MIAIFVYVGVEVATASNLPDYMSKELSFEISEIAPYISLYWASLMIGRWTGAVGVFTKNMNIKRFLRFLAPYLAFAVFLGVNAIAKHEVSPFLVYALVILVLIAADIASQGNPAKMLLIFSSLGIVALVIGILTHGIVSVYAFISVGLFCSTLWPCIFALALRGLGKHTSQGSSYLIMMIMGGGIISWLQGFVADLTSTRTSYIVGVVCFIYLVFYAWKVQRLFAKQGLSLETLDSSAAH